MAIGGPLLHVLNEGHHALVTAHKAVRRHVGLPRQQAANGKASAQLPQGKGLGA